MFADTNVQIADSETAILVEPEYFYWLEPLLIATPEDILGMAALIVFLIPAV